MFYYLSILSLLFDSLIDEIRSAQILNGVRGRPPYDKKAIRRLLMLCSEIVEAYPDIEEMDLNPVIVYKTGTRIVDARIILKKAGSSDTK
jgi:hypothetical protein